ncbi:DNA-binding protein [Agaribacter flavus]|uniref:DNA-binding protein n=1 Tax=Agaribacter flavus TaxID=1902781 RepID=A0ABV7FR70_9ALTE
MHPEIQLVIDCCTALHANGKKPTVGSVKSKLGNQVSLPAIITGLKQWPIAPQPKKEAKPSRPAPTAQTTDERIQKLEARVQLLEMQLSALLPAKAKPI